MLSGPDIFKSGILPWSVWLVMLLCCCCYALSSRKQFLVTLWIKILKDILFLTALRNSCKVHFCDVCSFYLLPALSTSSPSIDLDQHFHFFHRCTVNLMSILDWFLLELDGWSSWLSNKCKADLSSTKAQRSSFSWCRVHPSHSYIIIPSWLVSWWKWLSLMNLPMPFCPLLLISESSLQIHHSSQFWT